MSDNGDPSESAGRQPRYEQPSTAPQQPGAYPPAPPSMPGPPQYQQYPPASQYDPYQAQLGFPPAQPPAFVAPRPPRRFGIAVLVGVGVVVVAIVAAVSIVFVIGGDSNGSGASSPEAAALKTLNAVQRRDPGALVASIAPDESAGFGTVVASLRDVTDKAGYATGTSASGLFGGIDVNLSGVQTSARTISDDLAVVTIGQGQFDVRVDPSAAPESVIGKSAAGRSPGTFAGSAGDLVARDSSGRGRSPLLVSVKRNGQWYVSPTRTALAYFSGDEPTGAGVSVDRARTRFDTPEAAVRGFLTGVSDAINRSDVMSMAAVVSATAGGAISDFRDSLDKELTSSDLSEVAFSNITLSRVPAKEATLVRLDNVDVAGVVNGYQRSGAFRGGTCSDQGQICSSSLLQTISASRLVGLPSRGIVEVVRDRSGWRVDPVLSQLRWVADEIANATPQQIRLTLGDRFGLWDLYRSAKPDESLTVGENKNVVFGASKWGSEGAPNITFDSDVVVDIKALEAGTVSLSAVLTDEEQYGGLILVGASAPDVTYGSTVQRSVQMKAGEHLTAVLLGAPGYGASISVSAAT